MEGGQREQGGSNLHSPPSLRRAVFLDRDGVLNRAILQDDGKTHPPASPGELEILPGAGEACAVLHQADFLLIVVTNQPDVARGTQSREVVEAINEALREQVHVDDIRVCYHDDQDNCLCRKPRPGLLLESARDWKIDLIASFMVGDRWKDIEAGRRAGCRTFFVDHELADVGRSRPDFRVASLFEAADWILRQGVEL